MPPAILILLHTIVILFDVVCWQNSLFFCCFCVCSHHIIIFCWSWRLISLNDIRVVKLFSKGNELVKSVRHERWRVVIGHNGHHFHTVESRHRHSLLWKVRKVTWWFWQEREDHPLCFLLYVCILVTRLVSDKAHQVDMEIPTTSILPTSISFAFNDVMSVLVARKSPWRLCQMFSYQACKSTLF